MKRICSKRYIGRSLLSLRTETPRCVHWYQSRLLSSKSLAEEGELEHAKFGQFMDSSEGDARNKSALKFVERVQIEVKGGSGGNGCISHEVLSPGKKRPNGGNGGRGGNVFIVGSSQVESLHFPTYHFNGGSGNHGSSNGMTGKRGKDVYIHVPLGTVITEHIPEEYADYFYFDDGHPDEIAKARGKHEHEVVVEEEIEEEMYDDQTLESFLEDIDVKTTGSVTAPLPIDDGEGGVEEDSRLWALDNDDDYDDDDTITRSDSSGVSASSLSSLTAGARRKKNRRRKRRKGHFRLDEEDGDEGDNGKLLPALRREVLVDGETYMVAPGGENGIGNRVLAGSSKYRARSLPLTRTPGRPGMQRSLIMELKLIADVGLVGYPNAGKSTLLRRVSNAKPKVAPYPFTTLRPYLGVLHYNDQSRVTFADIPGLIDGAHANRGLGHTFLRHIERTKMLLYVVDGAGTEGRDPGDDLRSLIEELRLYNPELMDKPALVLANKIDLRGLFYREAGVSGLHDGIDIEKELAALEESEKSGDEDVYRGIEDGNTEEEEMTTHLERVAAEAGLTIIDGSADTGEGIAKLSLTIKAMIM